MPDEEIIESIISLFDARAAAVVATQTDRQLLAKVAPGVPVEMKSDLRIEWMIKQHLLTIKGLYYVPFEQLSKKDRIGEVEKALLEAVLIKCKENEEAANSKKSEKKKSNNKRPERKRYITSGIWVDEEGIITNVKIDGRPKSPFSNTMGAHTTAFIVYKDLIYSTLVGKNAPNAASALLTVIKSIRGHLASSMEIFHTDSKQLARINDALDGIEDCEGQLSIFSAESKSKKNLSHWDQVIWLQDCVVSILDLMNSVPGGTLDVADTNGKREGFHRSVLRNENADGKERRRSILGMLDLGGLQDYLETSSQNMDDDRQVGGGLKDYWQRNKHAHTSDQLPKPDSDPMKNAIFLLRHHLSMISSAYPKALDKTGLSVDAKESELKNIIFESLDYVNEDKITFKDVVTEDDED